jgi:CBS domain containing-hemolysin-like protein
MEDVIETMLGTEIVDENDTVTDMQELARERWEEQKQEMQEMQEDINEYLSAETETNDKMK